MVGLIAALKSLLELFYLMRDAYRLYQQAKREGWIAEGIELAQRIKNAKSDEERRQLVRDLVGHGAGA